ncbi:MAG: hypothetical protein ACLVAO_08505 [Clostridium fessum]
MMMRCSLFMPPAGTRRSDSEGEVQVSCAKSDTTGDSQPGILEAMGAKKNRVEAG